MNHAVTFTQVIVDNILAPTDFVAQPPRTKIDIRLPILISRITPGFTVHVMTRPSYMPEIIAAVGACKPPPPRRQKPQTMFFSGVVQSNAARKLIIQPPNTDYCYAITYTDLLTLQADLQQRDVEETLVGKYVRVPVLII